MSTRYRRTVFLAVVATGTLVWAAIRKFDVPPAELAWMLVYCIAGVLSTACLAALFLAVVIGGKKLWERIRN